MDFCSCKIKIVQQTLISSQQELDSQLQMQYEAECKAKQVVLF